MADTKITDLAELTAAELTDVIPIVDDPAGSPVTKKIEVGNLVAGSYGEIYTTGGTGSQTLSTGYSKLTQFDSDGESSADITLDSANNKITITNTGIYLIGLALSFSGTGSVTWDIAGYWNGIIIPSVRIRRKLGTGGDVGSGSCIGFIDVTSGSSDLEVYVNPDGATKDIDVKEAQLTVLRIAPT